MSPTLHVSGDDENIGIEVHGLGQHALEILLLLAVVEYFQYLATQLLEVLGEDRREPHAVAAVYALHHHCGFGAEVADREFGQGLALEGGR